MTHGLVYLNKDIAEKSGLSSFEPSVVVPIESDDADRRNDDRADSMDRTQSVDEGVLVYKRLTTEKPRKE
jgi:hypothetical protein